MQGTGSGKWSNYCLACTLLFSFNWCHGNWEKRWQNPEQKWQYRAFPSNGYDITVQLTLHSIVRW